ncbi:MAG: ABC transporter ATP-binding protein [Lachnospiraceae bacterium]
MKQPLNGEEDILVVEHLCKYFKENKAVDDVSFQVKKGEVFGLVGESGCGKTTIARSIIRLCDITSGNIYFKGERIASGGEKKRKTVTQIQMIFQDPVASLDPRMTVRQIIAEGLIIRGKKDKEEIDRQVCEIMETVGLLREHADRYPHEFSGGQRQRIGVARAIIMNPGLLIADEPVSALDVSVQAQVINLLDDLRHRMGLTILFIAHDLSVVKYFSDRIGVMYRGKLVELACAEELFANPLHPYTKALLSAIPLPDPDYEKHRRRIMYDPVKEHDYSMELPSMRKVTEEHLVYCNQAEFEKYKAQLQ